ncbi:MAG: arsenite efflux transporter metallochaperone ArsD [Piscinibacter sp.]|nr:arsenite efflux transporter metallochaperone ArsD [Piscinibacter sp.]
MSRLEIFEPAMCCPTGVCGASVDPALVQFNADLQALGRSGVEVVRHSLSHDAKAFAANADVLREMDAGMDRLPIVTVDGRVVSTGIYPSRAQLMHKLGLDTPGAEAPAGEAGACGCAPGKCC